MSKTGTYKMINGTLTKISDKIPSLKYTFLSFDEPQYHPAFGKVITSKLDLVANMEATGSIPVEPGMFKRPIRPNPQQRKRQIEEHLNQVFTDKGVEGIKLKDLDRTMAKERERGLDVNQPAG